MFSFKKKLFKDSLKNKIRTSNINSKNKFNIIRFINEDKKDLFIEIITKQEFITYLNRNDNLLKHILSYFDEFDNNLLFQIAKSCVDKKNYLLLENLIKKIIENIDSEKSLLLESILIYTVNKIDNISFSIVLKYIEEKSKFFNFNDIINNEFYDIITKLNYINNKDVYYIFNKLIKLNPSLNIRYKLNNNQKRYNHYNQNNLNLQFLLLIIQ